MLIRTLFLVFVCGTRAQNISAHISYILYISLDIYKNIFLEVITSLKFYEQFFFGEPKTEEEPITVAALSMA
jgi:hypothetical protein